MSRLNSELVKAALWRTRREKRGFVPSQGGDPAAGGAPPPGDPSAGGAPPPGDPSMGGAPPPGDPSMGGAPPPGDPSMGGAPPPGPPPGPDPSAGGMPSGGGLGDVIRSTMTDALSQAGLGGGKGPMGPNGKPTAPKPDINTIATDVFQLKKMFLHFCRVQNVELPPDILDGPNRDPQTGAPAASPSGGSDVQPGASAQPGGGDPSQAQSAIPPIGPMQGAFPGGPPSPGGGMGKTSSVGEGYGRRDFGNRAAAVTRMIRQRQRA